MSKPQNVVCVYNSTNSAMAELVRNLLQDEEIQAFVADVHQPFPGLPIAPAEVFVEISNEAKARAIIAAAEQVHRDAIDEVEDEPQDENNSNGDEVAD